MKLSLAILGCLLAVFVAYASADCSVTVKQTLGSSWTSNGQAYSQWNSQLVASGSEAVTAVTVTITGGDLDQLWELVKQNDGSYHLPDYRQYGGIPAGQAHQFGYIIKTSSQATVTVTAKSCGGAAVSPSPAAPSPSASPAAPSASASPAAPSPSSSPAPSTVVSTPQPSLTPQSCTIKVTQTARTTSDGHWTSGDFQFQIYDLVITNNGSYPVSQAEISFQLASPDYIIYQFWNLQREQADLNVFVIPTPWGALQVGASQGAGYIVRSPVSAGQQTAPGFIPGVATCVYGTTPSASASPAASASASPAASASASPSSSSGPIVSTPQPSAPAQGCAAKAALVARSQATGGKWDDGSYSYQIYDLTISNTGSKPVKAAQATFALASGTSISQWWELNQVSASVFNVAFNYGNLLVGASQGAGVVERYAKGTTPDAPTVSLGSVACA